MTHILGDTLAARAHQAALRKQLCSCYDACHTDVKMSEAGCDSYRVLRRCAEAREAPGRCHSPRHFLPSRATRPHLIFWELTLTAVPVYFYEHIHTPFCRLHCFMTTGFHFPLFPLAQSFLRNKRVLDHNQSDSVDPPLTLIRHYFWQRRLSLPPMGDVLPVLEFEKFTEWLKSRITATYTSADPVGGENTFVFYFTGH